MLYCFNHQAQILDVYKNEFTTLQLLSCMRMYNTVIGPNGNIIIACYFTIDIYDRNNKCIMKIWHNTSIICIKCMPNGKIVTSEKDHYDYHTTMTIWDPNDGKAINVIKVSSAIVYIVPLMENVNRHWAVIKVT